MGLEETLRGAAALERRHAEAIEGTAKRLSHPILKVLLQGVALDSVKHGFFYEAAAEAAQGKAGVLSRDELRSLLEAIEEHIRTEREMIEQVSRLVQETGDPRLRLVFEYILEDELRHHALLAAIGRLAAQETFDEEEFWETVWRESRRDSRHYAIGPRARRAEG